VCRIKCVSRYESLLTASTSHRHLNAPRARPPLHVARLFRFRRESDPIATRTIVTVNAPRRDRTTNKRVTGETSGASSWTSREERLASVRSFTERRFYLPLLASLGSRRPATPVFGHDVDVGVVSLVLGLQTGQVGRRGHASAGGHFAQTLEAMSGS